MNETQPTQPSPDAASLLIDELPLPYVEIDAAGFVTRANHAALEMHHPDQGRLVGKHAWDLMAIDEKDPSFATFMAHLHSGDDLPVVSRSLFDRSGAFRTYELHPSLMRSAEGKPIGLRVTYVDVSESKKALDEARRELQWLESAMASMPDAVVLTDVLGIVRTVNGAAEALLGFTASELKGKVIEDVAPILEFQSHDGAALERLAGIERDFKGIVTLLARDSKKVKAEISTAPVVDKSNGAVIGVVAILRRRSSTP